MKKYKINLLAVCAVLLMFMACKKDESDREVLAEGRVNFDLPAATDLIARSLDIKNISLVSMELKAILQGNASPDVHYITFETDTTKITDYRNKYGSSALLLPTTSYLFYKPTVALAAGTNISEPAILNLSYQTMLKARSTYVLPLAIASIDGQVQDPKTRRIIYYVFNTGEALYVDHTGYTLTATASSTNGTNVAGRAVDANTLGTYWLSNVTAALPQWVTADFEREVSFSGLDYFFPTAVVYATVGGNTTSAKIETSSDGTTWVDKGTYPVDIKNAERKQTINLPSVTSARYLRFTILTAVPYVSGGATYSVGFVGGIVLRN